MSERAREGHGAELRGGEEPGEDLRHMHGDRAGQAQGGGQVHSQDNRENTFSQCCGAAPLLTASTPAFSFLVAPATATKKKIPILFIK